MQCSLLVVHFTECVESEWALWSTRVSWHPGKQTESWCGSRCCWIHTAGWSVEIYPRSAIHIYLHFLQFYRNDRGCCWWTQCAPAFILLLWKIINSEQMQTAAKPERDKVWAPSQHRASLLWYNKHISRCDAHTQGFILRIWAYLI